MGVGNAFAALTQGWFGCVNQRNGWENRKLAQERQKKFDAYDHEEFGWKRDQHGVYMENAADENRACDLVYSDDQELRAAAARDLAAGDASFAGRDAGLSAIIATCIAGVQRRGP